MLKHKVLVDIPVRCVESGALAAGVVSIVIPPSRPQLPQRSVLVTGHDCA